MMELNVTHDASRADTLTRSDRLFETSATRRRPTLGRFHLTPCDQPKTPDPFRARLRGYCAIREKQPDSRHFSSWFTFCARRRRTMCEPYVQEQKCLRPD